MENGIASGNFGTVQDPDYRFELYLDWKSFYKNFPGLGAEFFCKSKGISQESLENLVREFDSYNQSGNRWGG